MKCIRVLVFSTFLLLTIIALGAATAEYVVVPATTTTTIPNSGLITLPVIGLQVKVLNKVLIQKPVELPVSSVAVVVSPDAMSITKPAVPLLKEDHSHKGPVPLPVLARFISSNLARGSNNQKGWGWTKL